MHDLKFGQLDEEGYWYTIGGVVKEIREVGMAEALRPAVYRLHEQADQVGSAPSGIVVRTAVDPASIVSAVRQAIWSIDKNQPLWHDCAVLRFPASDDPDRCGGLACTLRGGSLGVFCSRASRGEGRSDGGAPV
jgi:hypothetical protein